LLAALRQPRRTQLHDPEVRELFKQWKRLPWPIEYRDLWAVADLIAPGNKNPDARMRRRIVAAAVAAGVRISNHDSMRKWLAEGRITVQLTGEGVMRLAEEAYWRRPEWCENRPPLPEPPEWFKAALVRPACTQR
jgi:hypothetical protein